MNTIQKHDHVQLANYELIEKIGEGGYGFVFKARQLSTGQVVAIKMLRNQETLDESTRRHQHARFERETQLCAEISHPHIVRLLDKGFTDKKEPFAAFEFVEGRTLKDLILEKNGLTATETGILMGQVLDALASAHARGVIHRDLKPHNIMVTETGARSYVKVLDFGIGAFASGFRSNDYRSLTLTQEVVGTPAYCAPEQLRGEPSTPRSDLYSWGLIVLECLTGQPVVQGNGVAELFQQQLNAANVPLPASVAGHPLADLLRKVLEKNPRTRMVDSNKLLNEFSEINLSTLVGVLKTSTTTVPEDEATLANPLAWKAAQSEKRQLTILCLKLDLSVSEETVLDLETLDTIQRDQINLCSDTAIRFGGYIAGTLSNQVMIYFGYPHVSDNDARRAGRTALELVGDIKKRSALLYEQHGLRLAIRASIHTGTVLVTGSDTPMGIATDSAFRLLYATPVNQVLVSEGAKKILDPFLTFDEAPAIELEAKESTKTHLLTGERQTEALSFLRPRSASQQMVGRVAEKASLLQLWDQVTNSSGKAATVRGEAGIGKSRLVYEIKRYAHDENILVRECRCFPEHQNNALYPFFEVLKKSIGITAIENHEMALERLESALSQIQMESIETILPIFCSWLSIPLPDRYNVPEIPPAEQKVLLMNTMEKLLVSPDAEKPFIFIMEDLHWLDPTSGEFIGQLLGHLEQSGFLMLMTTRPEFEPSWTEGLVQTVALKELAHSDAQVLIQNILGESAASEQALQYITDRTDGIPLFIEELTHMLLDRNYLKVEGGQYELIEELEDKRIPVSLKDLLQARLDNLSLAKETAQVAATIGREFDYELLVKSSLRDEALVQSDLDQLLNSDLIFRQRRVEGEHYIFRHALIADAAYDSLTSSNKKEVHGRVADALESCFPKVKQENPEQLAKHWSSADEHDKAAHYGLLTTVDLLKKSLYQECFLISNTAIGWTRHVEDQELRTELELKISQNLVQATIIIKGFGNEEVMKINDRIEELSLILKDGSDWLSNILWTRVQFHLMTSGYQKYEPLWRKAVNDATSTNQINHLVALNTIEGYRLWIFGRYDNAEQHLEEALHLYDSINGKDELINFGIDFKVYAHVILANVYAFRGEFHKSEIFAKKGLNLAEEVNDAHTKALAVALLISRNFYLGEREKIEEMNSRYIQFIKDHNFSSYLFLNEMLDGYVKNDSEKALKYFKQLDETGVKVPVTYYEFIPALTLFNQGAYKEALEIIERLIESGIQLGEHFQLPELYRIMALCMIQTTPQKVEAIEKSFSLALKYSSQSKDDGVDENNIYRGKVLLDYFQYTKSSSKVDIIAEMKSYLKTLKQLNSEENGEYEYPQQKQINSIIKDF